MIRIAVEDQQIVVKIFESIIKEAEKVKMHYVQPLHDQLKQIKKKSKGEHSHFIHEISHSI